jgi:spermidine synthase
MNFLFITFFSAFLLFQVQPLIAKLILPQFGGGAAVWTACLLFFQTFLLFGYFYAHLLSQLKSLKHQASIHALLTISCWYFLPIGIADINPNDLPAFLSTSDPLQNILLLLAASIGLPYFLLSTTGPLLQRWLSIIKLNKLPYQLYSLSNVGSLLALLSFPFVFEPWLSSGLQSQYWSGGFILLSGALLATCWQLSKHKVLASLEQPVTQSQKPVTQHASLAQLSQKMRGDWLLWIALSAIGVIMLVATTNAMTQNVPPVPFLWIMPLCLYLLTFIISFHSSHWYQRWYWFAIFVVAGVAGLLMYFIGSAFGIISQVIIYAGILFSACMICHGELAKLKPEVSRLTLFYLMISFGGFLGSVFVTFVAQNIFQQFFEYPLAIIAVFVLLALSIWAEYKKPNSLVLMSLLVAVGLTAGLWQLNKLYVQSNIYSERNFYGIISVKDVTIAGQTERRLIDGTTSHGTQILTIPERYTPLSYYRDKTGVSLALLAQHTRVGEQGIKAGFVGLGAGTLAAYGQEHDNFVFYELNPSVIKAAQQHFTYLKDSKANISLIPGDARVSLTEQLSDDGSAQYDLLVVDAFSGDAIPQHLLTVEAFELYFKHLNKAGVLAIHVSNSHLDLTALVQATANKLNKSPHYFLTRATQTNEHDTQWIIIANNPSELSSLIFRPYVTAWPPTLGMKNKHHVWTDNHSDLLSVLK